MVDPEEEKARQKAEELARKGKPEEKAKGKELPSPTEPKLFKLLAEIKTAIEGKEYQEAHHIDRLITSIDKLTTAVNQIGAVSLLTGAKADTTPVKTETPEDAQAGPKASALEEIKVMFPNDLQKLLAFEDVGDSIKISPRQFLGSENFAKIASIVRDINGEYISAGKKSHFKVDK